jgi:hypothetical protein
MSAYGFSDILIHLLAIIQYIYTIQEVILFDTRSSDFCIKQVQKNY